MFNYLISIATIIGGVFWIFMAGASYNDDKYLPITIIMFMVLGALTIIGGLKLWP